MKRFIFGFHRRVWWPKWTPASRSCRMETTAIVVFPPVGCSPGAAPPRGDDRGLRAGDVGRYCHPPSGGPDHPSCSAGLQARGISGPGVRVAVDGTQSFLADVGVHLGRGQAGMAQELLDDPQIGAAVEE